VKLKVRRFRSLAVGLKDLEKFIRDGQHLYTGRPFKGLDGMRSREAVANWLMCAVISFESGRPFCFTSDPQGGDGIIYDLVNERDWPTEHIFVPRAGSEETRDIDTLILNAVQTKESYFSTQDWANGNPPSSPGSCRLDSSRTSGWPVYTESAMKANTPTR
jgi:hypothetical protein